MKFIKNLSDDDKEFFIIVLGILFITVSFFTCIFATIREKNNQPAKHYKEECIVNYVKYPLSECTYKEEE